MIPLANNLATATLVIAAGVSLLTLLRLFAKHADGRPLVAYEPRRPVPWNGWAALLLVAPMLLNLAGQLAGDSEPPQSERQGADVGDEPGGEETPIDAADFILNTLLTAATMLLFAGTAYVGLAALTGATPRDLGLPSDAAQFLGDVRLGAVAFAAALLPTYAIQITLSVFIEPTEGHPFVEEFTREPSAALMVAIGLAAMLAAPVFEETAFRLVLLGWLEKAELAPPAERSPENDVPERGFENQQTAAGPPGDLDRGEAEPPEPPGAMTSASPAVDPSPTHGWLPITITGILFGIAHWGHGVAPAPLALLGIILGYLYHRTHRVVPSMTCHLLFNAFTMWLLLLEFLSAE